MRLGKASVFGLVIGTMTIGLAATPAMADPGDVVVKPGQARPGEQVTVVGKKCEVDGETGSLAFVGGAVPLNGSEEVEGRAGLATIKQDTFPGDYTVLVRCGAHKSVGTIHVLEAKTPSKTQQPTPGGSAQPTPMGSARPTPSGGPKTGVGGGAGGADTALLAGGGVLLLGAFGAGAVAVRRRSDADA
ncbi:hypothetical protein [Actinomadura formosensis]|uniref:hypothetical protein n=1 Tax=Actinomadura formosensis TaxID=60706 RepID=UPI00083659CA|nr:hypothetical protein [Actinomadura formosensis]